MEDTCEKQKKKKTFDLHVRQARMLDHKEAIISHLCWAIASFRGSIL